MTAEPTPAKVLTKAQLKRAARDSKVRTRNVLFNPFRLEWPPVSRQAAAAVLSAVETQFEQFDINTGIPQEEYITLLAAGDRAAITARRAEVRAAAAPLLAARREHLADCVLGFNAASRALESGRLAALLVESETPALETRHLLPLAAGRRCPAVCLPRLRPALQRRVGLETAVLGLLDGVTAEGHHLRPLYDAVCAAASPLIPRKAIPAAAAPAAADIFVDTTAAAATDGDADSTASAAQQESSPAKAVSAADTASIAGGSGKQASGTNGTNLPAAESSSTASKDQPITTSSASASKSPSPPPKPEPFQQADFISLSVSPPPPSSSKRRAPDGPLLDLISLDTVGVPHKRRLKLKEAPVMRITLGNKAEKRAAKAAKKKKKKAEAKEG